jgi:septum formation protein
MAECGLIFDVIVKNNIDESYPNSLPIDAIPTYLSLKKSEFYLDEILTGQNIVITADTIVAFNNKVLGKPNDAEHAIEMLQTLSGHMHEVITGVTIRNKDKTISFKAITKVWFRNLTNQEINYYVAKYKPFDKAGAYGIQEWIGHIGIEKVEGSYFNVVGLPIQQLYKELSQF